MHVMITNAVINVSVVNYDNNSRVGLIYYFSYNVIEYYIYLGWSQRPGDSS